MCLVTWPAAADIKAAPVFVSFLSYTSYSHVLYQNLVHSEALSLWPPSPKIIETPRNVPGILPKVLSTALVFCPLFSITKGTKSKDVFFVSAAIPKSFGKPRYGREATPSAYKFETRSDLLLVFYLNISSIYYQKG